MKGSRRELAIDMVVHRGTGILKNKKLTLFPFFIFIPKSGVSFYSVLPTFVCLSEQVPLLSKTITPALPCFEGSIFISCVPLWFSLFILLLGLTTYTQA